jgi:hypothetical protein
MLPRPARATVEARDIRTRLRDMPEDSASSADRGTCQQDVPMPLALNR